MCISKHFQYFTLVYQQYVFFRVLLSSTANTTIIPTVLLYFTQTLIICVSLSLRYFCPTIVQRIVVLGSTLWVGNDAKTSEQLWRGLTDCTWLAFLPQWIANQKTYLHAQIGIHRKVCMGLNYFKVSLCRYCKCYV